MPMYEVEYASFRKVRYEAESQIDANDKAAFMDDEEIEEHSSFDGYEIWDGPKRVDQYFGGQYGRRRKNKGITLPCKSNNRRRKKYGLPKMYCKKGGKSDIQCPYYQDKYGVCMEDFECNEWLEDIARSLERWVIPAKLIVETLDEDVKVGNMIFKAGTKIYYCPECFGIIPGAQNFCGRCGKRIEL